MWLCELKCEFQMSDLFDKDRVKGLLGIQDLWLYIHLGKYSHHVACCFNCNDHKMTMYRDLGGSTFTFHTVILAVIHLAKVPFGIWVDNTKCWMKIELINENEYKTNTTPCLCECIGITILCSYWSIDSCVFSFQVSATVRTCLWMKSKPWRPSWPTSVLWLVRPPSLIPTVSHRSFWASLPILEANKRCFDKLFGIPNEVL